MRMISELLDLGNVANVNHYTHAYFNAFKQLNVNVYKF